MSDEDNEPVEIPYRELSPAALRGVVEAYVLREGTEYGVRDHTLEEKVAAVLGQLERGKARLMYLPASRGVEIIAHD